MATGPGGNQGKSKFVEEYLTAHGDARRAAINEAWRAAGHEDEISDSLVSKLRAKHGLSGGRKPDENTAEETAVREEGGGKRSSKKVKPEVEQVEEQLEVADDDQKDGSTPSKSAFVEEVLRRDPKATSKAVNQAWSDAGHKGTISGPTYYKVKSRLGASGEAIDSMSIEPKSIEAPKAESVKDKIPPISATTATSKLSESSGVVDEVEAGIDDLMFRLKTSGGMPEVEAALRAARRLLVRSQGE